MKNTPDQDRRIKSLQASLRARTRRPQVFCFPKAAEGTTLTTSQYVTRFCHLNNLTTGETK